MRENVSADRECHCGAQMREHPTSYGCLVGVPWGAAASEPDVQDYSEHRCTDPACDCNGGPTVRCC